MEHNMVEVALDLESNPVEFCVLLFMPEAGVKKFRSFE